MFNSIQTFWRLTSITNCRIQIILKCTKGLAEKLVQSITSNLIEKKFSTNKGRQISSIKLVLFVILQAKLIYSDQILKSNEKSRIRQQNKVEFCFYCYET